MPINRLRSHSMVAYRDVSVGTHISSSLMADKSYHDGNLRNKNMAMVATFKTEVVR